MFLDQTIIVDNFYTDPDAIRSMALGMSYNEPDGNWAGIMSTDAFMTPEHLRLFESITGTPNLQAGTQLCGKFRLSLASDIERQHIHFDPAPGQVWAGVIYLSLPQDYDEIQSTGKNCGTAFWRHKRTGLSNIFLSEAELNSHGWYGVEELRHFLETDGLDESLWEKTLEIPMKYNRLILFRPWMFHSPGNKFGSSFENCRLIQTFFLSRPKNP